MANGQWYPPEWPERIRALAAGELTPATPRRASTVMLLRDGPADGGVPGGAAAVPAVHMLRRRTSMAFAGGAYAYPGGGVDPRDDDVLVGWAGPPLTDWAARLGVDEAVAQAIVCAAVRETFEEAGVLLAGPTPQTVVSDTTGEEWEADRAAIAARELSFAQFLERRGLVLRSDLLGAWARWITPEFEPRRYDTWFFVAALPEGQRTRNASTEADRTVWITPAEAAERYDAGELLMMPPTVATLRQLTPYPAASDALAAAVDRDLTPVLARARLEDGEVVLSWPGHDEFTKRVLTDPGERPGESSEESPKGSPEVGPKESPWGRSKGSPEVGPKGPEGGLEGGAEEGAGGATGGPPAPSGPSAASGPSGEPGASGSAPASAPTSAAHPTPPPTSPSAPLPSPPPPPHTAGDDA